MVQTQQVHHAAHQRLKEREQLLDGCDVDTLYYTCANIKVTCITPVKMKMTCMYCECPKSERPKSGQRQNRDTLSSWISDAQSWVILYIKKFIYKMV